MSENQEGDEVNQRKVLYEPVAPYFASAYANLMSIVQGCTISALCFHIFFEHSITTLLIMKCAATLLIIGLIWHRYISHTQYVAWRLTFFDTAIPMVFAILQFWVISSITKTAFEFSLAYTTLTIWGFFAYLNSHIQYNNPISQKLFKEHFRDEGKDFPSDFFWEINKFEKQALLSMIITSVLFGATCAIIRFNDWSEETETYLASIVFIIIIILLFYFDINWKFKRSKKQSVTKYNW